MKKIRILVLCLLLVMLLVLANSVGYAYFSKGAIYRGMMGMKIDLLFDQLDEEGLRNYYNTFPEDTDIPAELPEWGTEFNPYVISNVKHLYNLSELQRLGYFEKNFIDDNYTDGVFDPTIKKMPYFYVSTKNGLPAAIEGVQQITAIGTKEFPFIGSVKGAVSKDYPCTVRGGEGETTTEKLSDTSVISEVLVTCDTADIDAGMFGHIGPLGTPGTPGTPFAGTVSEVSNLVLYDVTVEVKADNQSVFEVLLDHVFSYEKPGTNDEIIDAPKENHHIGILAGHVSHSVIEYISVFYSGEDKIAIDLLDASTEKTTSAPANYHSVSGILGFVDGLNPIINENGEIIAGSGQSSGGINVGSTATGGGGGAESGTMAGYVYASDIFNTYHYLYNKDSQQTVPVEDQKEILLSEALNEKGKPLTQEWYRTTILTGEKEPTGRYYFYDGVFTFALSGTKGDTEDDSILPTWASGLAENKKSFVVSTNADDAWKINNDDGSSIVAAFLKPVTSDAELVAAMNAKKQIVIANSKTLSLMSLYNQTKKQNADSIPQRYPIAAQSLNFADANFLRTLTGLYADETLTDAQKETLLADMTEDYNTLKKIQTAITPQGNTPAELQVVNVGITGDDFTLDRLKTEFKVEAEMVKDSEGNVIYRNFDENNTIVTLNSDGTIGPIHDYTAEYYADPDGCGYNGFFIMELTGGSWPTLTYTWIDFRDGMPSGVFYSGMTYPNEIFGETYVDTWYEEEIAEWYKDNWPPRPGTDKLPADARGVVIYYNRTSSSTDQRAKFYKIGSSDYESYKGTLASVDGKNLSMADTTSGITPIEYFYQNAGDTKWYYSKDNTVYTESLTSTGSANGGRPVYQATINGTTYKGVKVFKTPYYTFSNGSNHMTMVELERTYTELYEPISETAYAIWNGADPDTFEFANEDDVSMKVQAHTTHATLKFNGGIATIYYEMGEGIKYYAAYQPPTGGATGNGFFYGEGNASVPATLRIYTVEGTQALSFGRVTVEPVDTTDTTKVKTYETDKYLLFASHEEKDADTKYTVVSVDSLQWLSGGKEGSGIDTYLNSGHLIQKFYMPKCISSASQLNIGGTLTLEGNFLRAPVGTNGVEANIPQGCVAFRINKQMAQGETQKIRVIVALPATDLANSEESSPFYSDPYTRYFNLWKLEEAGADMIQNFEASSYLDRFELPVSAPYSPSATLGECDYIPVYGSTVTDGQVVMEPNPDYRCYLNGDRVLVAYEFTVTAEMGMGIYVMGMSGYDADNDRYYNSDDPKDKNFKVPMEVVYFSADGTSSEGRDGANESELGTIDFVYEHDGQIITVTDYSDVPEDGEDFSRFYPTYCILYFDNPVKDSNGDYVNINDEQILIRRVASGDQSTLYLQINSNADNKLNEYVKLKAYATNADEIDLAYSQNRIGG